MSRVADERFAPVSARGNGFHWLAGLLVFACFVFGVQQNYFLGDDAFISFRYAQNLSDGLGLVWNPGQRVEGYTNFLWVLILAGGIRLGLPPEILSNLLGIASGFGVLGITLWLGFRRTGPTVWVWLAPAALALNRSFCGWSTGGLATQFFAFLVLLGFARLLVEREDPRRLAIGSAVCFALASLTRPEGLLFAGVAGGFFLVDTLRARRSPGELLAWAAVIAVPVGAHLLWRYGYYGFWLPNTFYAKVSGAWWEQAARYFSLFFSQYPLYWFAPLLAVPVLAFRRFDDLLFTTILGVYGVYLGYIGGDRFEFRFLVVVLPYFFLLVATALWILGRGTPGQESAGRMRTTVSAAIAVALLGSSALGYVRERGEEWAEARIVGLDAIAGYADLRRHEGQSLRGWIDRGVLPEDLRVSTGGAGALSYYTRWPVLDYRGLNDVHIAHAPIEARGDIAHEKTATLRYLRDSEVVAFDVLNGMLFEIPPPRVRFHAERGRGAVRWHNREAERAGDPTRLRFECRKLGLGSYFLFASPLDEEQVERELGHLPTCREAETRSRSRAE